MPTSQTEVRGAPYSHVADGTLERKTLADGTLNATHLAAAVAAVDPKLCKKSKREEGRLHRGQPEDGKAMTVRSDMECTMVSLANWNLGNY